MDVAARRVVDVVDARGDADAGEPLAARGRHAAGPVPETGGAWSEGGSPGPPGAPGTGEGAPLAPEQPPAERRDPGVAQGLHRPRRSRHGRGRGVEGERQDADQRDGDEPLEGGGQERQQDGAPEGALEAPRRACSKRMTG